MGGLENKLKFILNWFPLLFVCGKLLVMESCKGGRSLIDLVAQGLQGFSIATESSDQAMVRNKKTLSDDYLNDHDTEKE
jgi:hypothetical protein